MRIFIPGRWVQYNPFSINWYGMGGAYVTRPTIVLDGHVDYQNVSFFEDTDGRLINNVSHSKPVGEADIVLSVPNYIDSSGNHYDSSGYCYSSMSGYSKGRVKRAYQVYPGGTLFVYIGAGEPGNQPAYMKTCNCWMIDAYFFVGRTNGSRYVTTRNLFSVSYRADTPSTSNHYPVWGQNPFGIQPRSPFGHEDIKLGPYANQTELVNRVIAQLEAIAWSWAAKLLSFEEELKASITDQMINRGSRLPNTQRSQVRFPTASDAFLFGENHWVRDGLDPALMGRNYGRTYWFNWLIQHAYADALSSAPRLNDNSISNAIELAGFIKSIVIDHRIEMPKRLQDAWLQYRYVYKTTELDIKEAISFVKRRVDLGSLSREISCYGVSSTDVDGAPVVCRCGLSLKSNVLSKLDEIWRALYTYGLQPNFYVVWDMIPYSFIVDWFLPVADLASSLDLEANYLRGQYTISNVCFSLSYDKLVQNGFKYHCYSRWASSPLSNLNQFYWFDRPAASDKVLAYRILDTASLVIN